MWWWLCCGSRAAFLGSLFRFVIVGFLVKFAEAGWLQEVSFPGIFMYKSYFGYHIVILGCQTQSFGMSVSPLWHAWDHFGALGTLCGIMGAAGRTRWNPKPGDGKHYLE